jgi:hypothetical protein
LNADYLNASATLAKGLMLFNLLQNLNPLIASPLDQFGTDTDTTGVIENSVTDLFITSSTLSDIISFIGISDVDNFGN